MSFNSDFVHVFSEGSGYLCMFICLSRVVVQFSFLEANFLHYLKQLVRVERARHLLLLSEKIKIKFPFEEVRNYIHKKKCMSHAKLGKLFNICIFILL